MARAQDTFAAKLDQLFEGFKVEVEVRIEAPIERVWDLVTDVTRIGEFSLETVGAEWVRGATGPAVGAFFVGHNKVGDTEWSRLCMVDECDPPHRFGYVVGDRFDGSPTGRWSFELTPDGTGTIIRQRYAHAPRGRSRTRLRAEREPHRAPEIVAAQMRFVRENVTATLEGMREALEAA